MNSKQYLLRYTAIITTFITGFTGLVYEVSWQRYLANLLGSHARATALILAVFLGGLSLGYNIFGKVSKRVSSKHLVFITGIIEALIGIWALLFPSIFSLIFNYVGVLDSGNTFTLLRDAALAFLLLGFPTILMGGTLPLLTQGLSKDLIDAPKLHTQVYATNTGGAFFGTLAAGFILLPAYGLRTTMYAGGVANLLAGLTLCLLALNIKSSNEVKVSENSSQTKISTKKIYYEVLIAFLAGFYSITFQSLFVRIIGLTAGSSEYAFSMIVGVYILMLALGAWRLSQKEKAVSLLANQIIVALGSLIIYFTITSWPYSAYVLRTLFATVQPNFYVYHIVLFLCISVVLYVPVGAMGATMPLIFRRLGNDLNELGQVVGKIYSANTFGCVLGALVGGYSLLNYFNLDGVYKIATALCFVNVLFSAILLNSKLWIRYIGGFLIIASLLLPNWNKERLSYGLFRDRQANIHTYSGADEFYKWYIGAKKLLAYKDDPNTSVSVSERPASPSDMELNSGSSVVRNLRVNAKSDGETSSTDTVTMRLATHLPMLLSTQTVEKAAVIGFGLGITSGSLTLYPEVKDVHCIEISDAVKDFSSYFDFANYNVSKNPKIRWSIGDAYRILGSSDDKYNLIISEPSNPWVVGVERLFTEEFYKLIRNKLQTGGMYLQWFHTYSISEDTFALVLRTFGANFPHVRVFWSNRDVFMIGSEEEIAKDSVLELKKKYSELPQVREALSQVGYNNIDSFLASELWLPKELYYGNEMHTLEFPKLSYRAGKDFFMAADADLWGLVSRTYFRPWARRYATKALIRYWLEISDDKKTVIKEFAKSACKRDLISYYSNWEYSTKSCRDSLFALMILGEINPPEEITEEYLKMLKLLIYTGNDELDLASNLAFAPDVSNARTLISLFKKFDSAFLPLSPGKLLKLSNSCITQSSAEASKCRAELAEALASAGYGEVAKNAFFAWRGAATDDERKYEEERLKDIVDEAIQAELRIMID